MSSIAAALGVGPTFDYQGTAYRLSPWTYKIQAEFERYLEDQALRTVKRMRPYCNDVEYRDLLSAVSRDIASGYYNFGGEAVNRAMGTITHLKTLLLLCLKPNHPTISPEIVDGIVQEKLDEVMAKMSEANADPNRTAPAETASSLPPAGAAV